MLDVSLARTMHYCLVYHYHSAAAAKSKLASPADLRQVFGVDERMWCFYLLGARTTVRDWAAVKALVSKGSMFTGPKSPIGFEPFLHVLSRCASFCCRRLARAWPGLACASLPSPRSCCRNNAPSEVADYFAACISDKDGTVVSFAWMCYGT